MTSTLEEPGAPLARVNPEDEPDTTMTAMTHVGPPARAALAVQRSSGMQHLDELMRYATIFATAGVFKGLTAGDLKRQAAMCAVKVIAGDELGLPPMAAMRSLHVFDGKVELSGSLIMSLINRYQVKPAPSGLNYKARIVERTDSVCTIGFFSREPGEAWEHLEDVRFSIQDAQRAGLTGKDNWKMYPRPMLFNRCASEGARVHASECFNGPVYGAGEISGAAIDEDGEFLATKFENATNNAAAAVMEFDAEILDLASRAGWTQAMLEAQAVRFGDRGRLLDTLKKTVERTENSARGRARSGKTQEPEEQPALAPHDATFEEAKASDQPGSITEHTRHTLFAALSRRGIKEKSARIAWAREHDLKVNPRKGAPNKEPSFANLSESDALAGVDILTVLVGDERRDRVLLARCEACGAQKNHAHDRNCPLDETND